MDGDTEMPQVLRFDVFELDVRAGELGKKGTKLRLQGQPLQVLGGLLKRPGGTANSKYKFACQSLGDGDPCWNRGLPDVAMR